MGPRLLVVLGTFLLAIYFLPLGGLLRVLGGLLMPAIQSSTLNGFDPELVVGRLRVVIFETTPLFLFAGGFVLVRERRPFCAPGDLFRFLPSPFRAVPRMEPYVAFRQIRILPQNSAIDALLLSQRPALLHSLQLPPRLFLGADVPVSTGADG